MAQCPNCKHQLNIKVPKLYRCTYCGCIFVYQGETSKRSLHSVMEFAIPDYKPEPLPKAMVLQELLSWGQDEERRCLDLLKVLSPEAEEYGLILFQCERLQEKLTQIKGQIAAKR